MSSQYEKGHLPEPQQQTYPGHQDKMDPQPISTLLPSEDSSYTVYKAAGKLLDKRALITGGDSGIGRATAVLFAMEGADCVIVYLPEEERDAQQTKSMVEETGRKCVCLAADVRSAAECKKLVEEAVEVLGGLDILVNNAAYQMMVEKIDDLSEYV